MDHQHYYLPSKTTANKSPNILYFFRLTRLALSRAFAEITYHHNAVRLSPRDAFRNVAYPARGPPPLIPLLP